MHLLVHGRGDELSIYTEHLRSKSYFSYTRSTSEHGTLTIYTEYSATYGGLPRTEICRSAAGTAIPATPITFRGSTLGRDVTTPTPTQADAASLRTCTFTAVACIASKAAGTETRRSTSRTPSTTTTRIREASITRFESKGQESSRSTWASHYLRNQSHGPRWPDALYFARPTLLRVGRAASIGHSWPSRPRKRGSGIDIETRPYLRPRSVTPESAPCSARSA